MPSKPDIAAGRRNKPVNLRIATVTTDANGGVVKSATVDSEEIYWAEINPLTGREFEDANRLKADVTHVIRMLYSPATAALKPKDAIVYNNRVFEIVSKLNPEEKNVLWELMCKEVVSN